MWKDSTIETTGICDVFCVQIRKGTYKYLKCNYLKIGCLDFVF